MLFVMWMAWCVSLIGTPNYDDVDARHEARMAALVQSQPVDPPGEGPARAAQRALKERLRAL